MPTLIFTADDYGAFDQIDDGILHAVENGWINSVAMFANGGNRKKSAEKIVALQHKADVGLHFTLNSGAPLTKEMQNNPYFASNGAFRNFMKLRRGGTFSEQKKEAQKQLLKKEIKEQIRVLRVEGIIVKHISHHFNVLFFFPDFMEALFEVIEEDEHSVQIKSRSSNIMPVINKCFYPLTLNLLALLNGGLDPLDSVDRASFMYHIKDWVSKYENRTGRKVPKAPMYTDSAHYGPLGIAHKGHSARIRRARKKAQKFPETLQKYIAEQSSVEFLFHLINPKGVYDLKSTKEKLKKQYKGVAADYIDSRMIEFKSLEQMFDGNGQITLPNGDKIKLEPNCWDNI